MCENYASEAFRAVVERLSSADSFVVVTHARPDGDALGSMSALVRAGRQAGKVARMIVPDAVPPQYMFLFDEEVPAGAGRLEGLADDSDLVVVVDTCAFSQLDGLEDVLRARREKIIVIDHHTTGDDLGSARWIDTSASAVGVMTGEVLEALNWAVDGRTAEALFTAVTTDTGWFRFSNTDPRSLRAAAGWVDLGASPDAIYARLYQSDRPERLRLLQRTLASLELHCDGCLAVMTIRRADFDWTGARPDETENFINEALRIKSVQAVVLLVENGDCVRASLRSRAVMDVAAVARRFGGGGHARAAGLRASEELDELKDRLIRACEEALKTSGLTR